MDEAIAQLKNCKVELEKAQKAYQAATGKVRGVAGPSLGALGGRP